jgi:flagellar basal body-associated protein FliL
MGQNLVGDGSGDGSTTEKYNTIHNIINNNIHQHSPTDYTNWIILIVLVVALVVAIGGALWCYLKLQKCKQELITPPTNSENSPPKYEDIEKRRTSADSDMLV